MIEVSWGSTVQLSGLALCFGIVNDVHNEKDNGQSRGLRRAVFAEARSKYIVETLKDDPTVRAYRDLYWRLGVDPTKTRPSGEALLRRVLNGNDLPNVSTIVDAYNLTSMKTIIPISGFDKDCLHPPFQVRFAENSEAFRGIGMIEPMLLTDKLLVLADQKQVLCVYPYRDSDSAKITASTQHVMIVAYGAPGIAEEQLRAAVEMALSYIRQVAGGEIETVMIFEK